MSRLTRGIGGNSAKELRCDDQFDAWAQSYDEQPNPLLTLEKRYLEKMLPDLSGQDVLDSGCGSGRWLSYLAGRKPHTLRGIDISATMLEVAAQKEIPGAELCQGPCNATPFGDHCFDLILSSFVLSYIEDIYGLAAETDRIARNGCHLFLSDMHPETQECLGWRRTFRKDQNEIELKTVTHGLRKIAAIFDSLGWELCSAIEPEFGTPEREIFASTGRLHRFHEAHDHPAIYLLHLQKCQEDHHGAEQQNQTIIRSAFCAFGPHEKVRASVRMSGGRVTHLLSDRFPESVAAPCNLEIDLNGYLLLPGLINAHDHLEYALFPRLASSGYPNASAWARDIQNSFADEIALHRSVPRDVRLWWGGLRNLLCGATTVCHHNPPQLELQRPDFPVRVVQEFGWGHSLTFGGDLHQAYSATPQARAFIVHACEGIDNDAQEEIWELDRLGVLDANTVLVHGLAMDREGVALMRERGASLVVCPSSNKFLFGRVPDMHLLGGIDRLALGSDSPLTAVGDLLDELQFAARFCDVPPQVTYGMVTEAPAAMLRLQNAEGSIRVAGRGDLIAIRDTTCNAADRLQTLSASDVEFVMIGGRVRLASEAVLERLPLLAKQGLEPLWIDGTVRWLRAPVSELLRRAEEVLGAGNVRLGGKPIRIPARMEAHHVC